MSLNIQWQDLYIWKLFLISPFKSCHWVFSDRNYTYQNYFFIISLILVTPIGATRSCTYINISFYLCHCSCNDRICTYIKAFFISPFILCAVITAHKNLDILKHSYHSLYSITPIGMTERFLYQSCYFWSLQSQRSHYIKQTKLGPRRGSQNFILLLRYTT